MSANSFEKKMRPPKGLEPETWIAECYRRHEGHPLKILLAIYKGNYYKFALAVLFFFIKHACVWVLPIVTANIINDITSGNPDCLRNTVFYTVLMIALIVVNVPMNYLYTDYKSQATRYAETGLRKALIRKLQQLSIAYHVETRSGRLQSKIMRDVEAVEGLTTQMFINVLNIALNIIVALVVTVNKSFVVFLFFLLTTPLAAVSMVIFRSVMKKRNAEFRREMEETSARVMEMVELIPVTRAHALEEEEVRKMSSQLFAVAEKGYKLDLVQALFGSVGWAIFQIFQVICLAFTGWLALQGGILVGDIALYQNYFATIVNQVSAIITLVPVIAKGIESVTSIGEVILSDDVESNEGKREITNVEGRFSFKDVYFKYDDNGEKNILNGLNLEVAQGETVALVGESGAGKTTILNMVIGFYLTKQGQVLLDGQNINEIDLRSYRRYLAVVPQTSILFSGTIRDNIVYGCENVTDERLDEVIKAANLKELIDSLPEGLDTKVGEHGGKLSGGQRQRISIARALIRDPKVIVLDEATSALDSISEKLIQEAVNNLTANRTTFIVAHRLSTIRDADRIAVIDEGRCVEYGTYEELMALGGRFYQMKKIQS
ncbi:MAG: ABC transporter ATP-binding protein/permease [Clostridium sp.]|nr:ABC transporter ATP-binding protein/permease [Acetatifactor muris]MCM1527089.1 ABC transporter ATP-binding protein/permease [Bacteroides sp.]MCM1563404.1 ABC transporter ATP-binding protein/permease [Clostridium sp.]